ncbi:MAG TPA: OmpA family protein [Bacteroidia bacterium]
MENIDRMKKILSCLGLITGFVSVGISQSNLVANPGMEGKHIGSGYGQINRTETWTNANGGTVDLFDRSKSPECHHVNAIPENYMGYQPLAAVNQNYAGIIAYYDDGANNAVDSEIVSCLRLKDGYKKYTEYLQGEFSQPLEAGKVYQVSFRASLADKSSRAVSCLGALITKDKVEQKSNTFLTMTPQFISHRVITDTANWIELYGAYIAEGGEKYITVGCFKDEENFTMENISRPMQNDSRKAYYYIADVSVDPYVSKPDMDAIVLGVEFVELMDLRFSLASSDIEPKFYNELDDVAGWMIKHPEMTFFVAGYTDKTGTDAINDPLSVSRANAVKKYLVSKGVKESNLITEGFGSENPIESKIKSRKNRRVEIYLYSVGTVSQR